MGDRRLDRPGRPTAGSTLTIDRADERWLKRFDFLGTRRDARPDIGAYEYVVRRRR
ncbi:MAG TPA: hypothetical protein VD769_00430 [Gaiellaceae bacterium]|nr:hypothetical protein [Gaiellaceae bacterium]